MVYPPKKKKSSATTDWLKECRRKQAEELLQMVREAWAPDEEKENGSRKDE